MFSAVWRPALCLGLTFLCSAQEPPAAASSHTCAQMEELLLKGTIGGMRDLGTGVTIPKKATLVYESLTHDASIQTVDIHKQSFQTTQGTELNFRDSWKYNVAGYELAKILELNMVPPYVERKVKNQDASFSWWINDAMMELNRVKNKVEVPDPEAWNKQMYAVRVFHELIYDTDPNLTNILITKDWQIWAIDFTRAFRLQKNVRDQKNLVQCDRKLLAKLRGLKKDELKEKLSRWLTKDEIEGVAARAGKIVEFFDKQVASKGEAAILYDLPRSSQACGTGL
jgi:hypothetical protein